MDRFIWRSLVHLLGRLVVSNWEYVSAPVMKPTPEGNRGSIRRAHVTHLVVLIHPQQGSRLARKSPLPSCVLPALAPFYPQTMAFGQRVQA